jgi:hypothetical protein
LISFTQFLESHNLAFRGHRETLFLGSPQNSRNLIDLVKLLSKYDPVLREHFHRIHENDIRDHYLSYEIHNEQTELMCKVKETTVNKIKRVKYFTILLDCTRDAGRVEQMSIILR